MREGSIESSKVGGEEDTMTRTREGGRGERGRGGEEEEEEEEEAVGQERPDPARELRTSGGAPGRHLPHRRDLPQKGLIFPPPSAGHRPHHRRRRQGRQPERLRERRLGGRAVGVPQEIALPRPPPSRPAAPARENVPTHESTSRSVNNTPPPRCRPTWEFPEAAAGASSRNETRTE